ncbi:SDR family oxidoreductase [Aquibium carbonis]|uniref:SDR family oxidoreductase n=1 Tax=Aquibium carbonis TaxID=2495581 RepID=A0A3S0G9V8_9HYPH|nr:SDR family oxidoreductase [Aquibium carbonis]RST87010.1 SDR family oxidoreductase [Aquibium carbonis]
MGAERNSSRPARILITGATSGIGLALVRRHAPKARVLAGGRRAAADAHGVLPDGVSYVQADQREPERAVAAILGGLDELGWDGLDLAILNAGIGHAVDPAEETPSMLRDVLDTNLFAAIALAQALLARLEAGQGRLVLIGSTAHKGAPGFASYAAAKAGLHGFARALSEEWKGRVAVQVIHPGPTDTGMHARAGHDPGRVARLFARTETMARLIDRLIAGGRTVETISFARFLGRGQGGR